MRSVVVLSVVVLLWCVVGVSSFGFPPRPSRPIARHFTSSSAPSSESYPGLVSSCVCPTANTSRYTIWQLVNNPSLIGNTQNISWTFNITSTHLGHMPWLETQMNSTGGPGFTMFLPDDMAMWEAKSRWEACAKEQFNVTSFDLSKVWNYTEHNLNEPIEKEAMEWTHAGIAWSIVQGNHSLFNLSSNNLLPTMLNDTRFVRLGPNQTQFMRIVKGDNVTVYGIPMSKKFPEMTHTNRTDVMIISGSGQQLYQISHIYREICASNGRIYILDRAVDLPLNTTDVLKAENATLFLSGITKSNFNDTVNNTPNMTILVPTDNAIYESMKQYAMNNETYQKWTEEHMKAILTPYIINGTYYGKDLNTTTTLRSIGGHLLNVTTTPTETIINGNISVIQSDILTRNGVIHIINGTLTTIEKQIIETLPK